MGTGWRKSCKTRTEVGYTWRRDQLILFLNKSGKRCCNNNNNNNNVNVVIGLKKCKMYLGYVNWK